ncbi:hypothetical protein NXV90_00520 [Bacteroides ovatus]|nr:hypothetical protein [Bacteroides ovatus]
MDYVIIVGLVIVLVCVQFKVFLNNCKLIKEVENLFPLSNTLFVLQNSLKDNALIDDIHETGGNVESIKVFKIVSADLDKNSSEFRKILDSINNYLQKNKGAVSDFMLIKDIVERNCDSKEEEITIQTPIPLYIGLMGTMLGIIIGIGRIAIMGGGFSAFIDNPQQAIGELMGGVAIAMLASLTGILLTTISSWKSKTSKNKLEADKNGFYSWIQAGLLPVLSGNMANTLQLLQQNLTSFNLSFSFNIGRMENALKEMSGSFADQLKILELLKNLDIKRMTTANVSILQQFEKSTANFQQLATYLSQTSDYLQAVRQLNNKVGEYMEQTSALTNLSTYFQEENNYFQMRRSEINKAVVQVDDTLKKSFLALQDNAEEGINNLAHFLVEQQSKFSDNLKYVEEKHQQWLAEQREIMFQHIDGQDKLFKEKINDLDVVIDEIKNLAAIKECMVGIEQSLGSQSDGAIENLLRQNRAMMERQSEQIEHLCSAIKNLSSINGVVMATSPKKNMIRNVALWILGIMMFLASGSALLLMCMALLK